MTEFLSGFARFHGAQTFGLHVTGMTLRDYMAAKALPQCFEVSTTTDIAAKEAYRMADAMLKAREA